MAAVTAMRYNGTNEINTPFRLPATVVFHQYECLLLPRMGSCDVRALSAVVTTRTMQSVLNVTVACTKRDPPGVTILLFEIGDQRQDQIRMVGIHARGG